MFERIARRYSFGVVFTATVGVIFLGFAIPMATVQAMHLRPDDALPVLAGWILPTSLLGLVAFVGIEAARWRNRQ